MKIFCQDEHGIWWGLCAERSESFLEVLLISIGFNKTTSKKIDTERRKSATSFTRLIVVFIRNKYRVASD